MECWRKNEIPERFAYGTHRRIPPYFCLPETGWTIALTQPEEAWTGGSHGYDPAAPEMAALFVGHGPAFRSGATLPPFRNNALHKRIFAVRLPPNFNPGRTRRPTVR